MAMYKEQTSLHKQKFKKDMDLSHAVYYNKVLPPSADYHSWHGCLMVPYKDSSRGKENIYIYKTS
jgi:hypothetical protein